MAGIDSTTVQFVSSLVDWFLLINLLSAILVLYAIYTWGNIRGQKKIEPQKEAAEQKARTLTSDLEQTRNALQTARNKIGELEGEIQKWKAVVRKEQKRFETEEHEQDLAVRQIREENQKIVTRLIEDHQETVQKLAKRIQELETELKQAQSS